MDLRRAKRLLEGSGLSVLEAVRAGIEARRSAPPAKETALIEEAIAGWLERCVRMKRSEQTHDFYESKLKGFADAFAGRRLGEVDRAAADAWLHGLKVGHVTRAGYLRAAHAMYVWASTSRVQLCFSNPFAGLRLDRPSLAREVMILSAAEVAAILAGAGPYRHALALMVFAGIRPHEVAGRRKAHLLWEHVDRKARMIRIPSEIAKTRRARVLEQLPPVVWAWLKDAPKAGPVSPGMSRQVVRRAWEVLAPMRPGLMSWPQDVLRHTAASYLLRLWKDIGRVSEVIGHEGRTHLLRQRYLALMTDAEARAIAALRP